ncbi:MAG TPA: alpha-L-fucosidase C-terminal domain-containing protein, partial [Niabella sp.]|nr:alpha-L-fucosidase C-terminal domain-containing protein [Niabella sp.]
KDVVANVGVWLWSYGESIYGTRPYSVATETTAQGYQVYYTKNNKTLYAIFLDWPRNGEFVQLKKLGMIDTKSAVKAVTVLGLKEPATCSFTQTNEQLLITIPHKTRIPSDIAQVLKIELE